MNRLTLVAAVTALSALAAPAFAQDSTTLGNSDSQSIAASVQLVCPLTVAPTAGKTNAISFGRLVLNSTGLASGASVKLQSNNNLVNAVGVVPVSGANAQAPTTAFFSIRGEPAYTYVGSLSTTAGTTPTGGAGKVTFVADGYNGADGPQAFSKNTEASGCQREDIAFGGDLTIASDAPRGTYNWTTVYTVTYQ